MKQSTWRCRCWSLQKISWWEGNLKQSLTWTDVPVTSDLIWNKQMALKKGRLPQSVYQYCYWQCWMSLLVFLTELSSRDHVYTLLSTLTNPTWLFVKICLQMYTSLLHLLISQLTASLSVSLITFGAFPPAPSQTVLWWFASPLQLVLHLVEPSHTRTRPVHLPRLQDFTHACPGNLRGKCVSVLSSFQFVFSSVQIPAVFHCFIMSAFSSVRSHVKRLYIKAFNLNSGGLLM